MNLLIPIRSSRWPTMRRARSSNLHEILFVKFHLTIGLQKFMNNYNIIFEVYKSEFLTKFIKNLKITHTFWCVGLRPLSNKTLIISFLVEC